jgi:hypothetical protein
VARIRQTALNSLGFRLYFAALEASPIGFILRAQHRLDVCLQIGLAGATLRQERRPVGRCTREGLAKNLLEVSP